MLATLEPSGLFKEHGLHKVQWLEIPLVPMDALSVNYWLTKFVQEVAKPSKERYPPKTFIYLFICDVYTGNPIQQRWFKRRPVYILALYTRFTHYIQLTY